MSKYILNGKLDIEPLITARNFLQKALQEAQSELEIAGIIQASLWSELWTSAYKTCWKTQFKRKNIFASFFFRDSEMLKQN